MLHEERSPSNGQHLQVHKHGARILTLTETTLSPRLRRKMQVLSWVIGPEDFSTMHVLREAARALERVLAPGTLACEVRIGLLG